MKKQFFSIIMLLSMTTSMVAAESAVDRRAKLVAARQEAIEAKERAMFKAEARDKITALTKEIFALDAAEIAELEAAKAVELEAAKAAELEAAKAAETPVVKCHWLDPRGWECPEVLSNAGSVISKTASQFSSAVTENPKASAAIGTGAVVGLGLGYAAYKYFKSSPKKSNLTVSQATEIQNNVAKASQFINESILVDSLDAVSENYELVTTKLNTLRLVQVSRGDSAIISNDDLLKRLVKESFTNHKVIGISESTREDNSKFASANIEIDYLNLSFHMEDSSKDQMAEALNNLVLLKELGLLDTTFSYLLAKENANKACFAADNAADSDKEEKEKAYEAAYNARLVLCGKLKNELVTLTVKAAADLKAADAVTGAAVTGAAVTGITAADKAAADLKAAAYLTGDTLPNATEVITRKAAAYNTMKRLATAYGPAVTGLAIGGSAYYYNCR